MLFKMLRLRFYRLLGKYHIYLNHKQNCICCMGKRMRTGIHKSAWAEKILHNHLHFFFLLSDYNFVGKEKCSKTQETH